MVCPKCNSDNVNIQAVSVTEKAHHGILWWVFVGWWWLFFKWLFLTIPALIVKILGGGKTKAQIYSYAVCQNCGNKWRT